MAKFAFYTTDVFTDRRFGGNQLAVFPDATGLDPALYQTIAREFNFSETTFVLPPSDPKHTRRVKIFTPGGELQFAGHPTVGTAVVLAHIGAVKTSGGAASIVFEEGVGPVPVAVRDMRADGGFAQLTVAKLPEKGPPPPPAGELARCLGLDAADLHPALPPEGYSCGTPFLFVPVRDRKALGRSRPVLDVWDSVLGRYWTGKVFLFCDEPELKGSHFRARMYAPGIGVPEDPATGGACAAFGGYVGSRDGRGDGTRAWRIEQGFEMGRPSLLELEVDKKAGALTAVRVGGNAVIVSGGEFYV
jgi:trans-2,3-dihydro-3-hydroxyanthranilate isomerase